MVGFGVTTAVNERGHGDTTSLLSPRFGKIIHGMDQTLRALHPWTLLQGAEFLTAPRMIFDACWWGFSRSFSWRYPDCIFCCPFLVGMGKKGGDAYYVNLSMSSMSSIYPSMSHWASKRFNLHHTFMPCPNFRVGILNADSPYSQRNSGILHEFFVGKK